MTTHVIRFFFAMGLALLLSLPLTAQAPRHIDQVHEPPVYDSLNNWLGRAAELRTHILVSTGLQPMPEKTPLNPRLSDPIEGDGYTVQSVVLETLPGFYLTGNLYRPSEGEGPFPAVLTAHGHWNTGRFEDSETASIPGRAVNFARQGYVVLSYSMIGYNETADALPHRFDEERYRLWGFSAMGLQLWNSIRALDYLTNHPDVDPERIGMTGASGGGTQTFMLTAIDSRIKVAAPVNMISAHFQGGCICENGPSLRVNANNLEIGALAAPRPLLMVSTSGDWTTNTPEVEYPAIRSIYRLFDAEDRIANVHLDYPHNYNRDSREAVYAWFARWLLGSEDPPREQPFTIEPSDTLSADLPAPPAPLDTLFAQHVDRLRHQINAAQPGDWPGLYAYREQFGTALRHSLHADVEAPTLDVYIPSNRSQAGAAVLIVHTPADSTRARTLADEYRSKGTLVALLQPYPEAGAFVPPDSINYWTTYNPAPHALRVAEIRVAAEHLLDRPDVTGLDLVGIGKAGPWTFLARSLVPSVRRTHIDFAGQAFAGDDAFLQQLSIPLIRRAGDFKTAAALTAPAALTVENLPDGEVNQWIQAVYAAAGASEMLSLE